LNIRFTSSLTAEDENLIAPALIKAIGSILDVLPLAYAIRVDTSDGQVFQHGNSGVAMVDEMHHSDSAPVTATFGSR
jgi:hypothetical protein